MAVEARRGCGYRKVGGLYIVSGAPGLPCCKLPIPLHVCPTCGEGVKQGRGWQWIDPQPWLQGACRASAGFEYACPAAMPEKLGPKVGLLWIGSQFYPTASDFSQEALMMGISRRIQKVPRGFKVGEHWVFLAHPKGIAGELITNDITGEKQRQWTPAIFQIFKPDKIELIITQSQSEDPAFMADLEKRGLSPVIVPDDDPDHRGTAYDNKAPELALEDA